MARRSLLRQYSVHAITARGNLPEDRLVYSARHGLYDPDAILFVDANHLEDLRAGLREPEPLILRAAAGECIQVSLTNELPEELPPSMHFNFNPPIVDYFNTNQVRTSNHVSLNAQLVAYDPRLGDGANVGHNPVQTVAPGETRITRWYAWRWERGPRGSLVATPIEFGVVNLRSMVDVVNHGVHGAVGALFVEPLGATWVSDPGTEAQATVSYVDSKGYSRMFGEFVIVIHDELAIKSDDSLFAGGDPVEPTALSNLSEYDDAQESGHYEAIREWISA